MSWRGYREPQKAPAQGHVLTGGGLFCASLGVALPALDFAVPAFVLAAAAAVHVAGFGGQAAVVEADGMFSHIEACLP